MVTTTRTRVGRGPSSSSLLFLVSAFFFYFSSCETTTTVVVVVAFVPSFVVPQQRHLLPPPPHRNTAPTTSHVVETAAATSLHLFGSSSGSSSSSKDSHHNNKIERRLVEFSNLEPLVVTDARKQRMKFETQMRSKFVRFGNELWDLRSTMDNLASKLRFDWEEDDDTDHNNKVREQLRDFEQRDPELAYMLELAALERANREGRTGDADLHRESALAARSCLPYFHLDGLWVGKYGANGYELINVTYVGDTLIATKVTGDQNVPRGEVTFQVDLHPLRQNNAPMPKALFAQQHGLSGDGSIGNNGNTGINGLQPIQLTERAARKWGTRKLARYAGLGQVAEEGFQNHQWMEGQLIMIGEEYFSFAWIPIEHQIFFGRPSPELALKLLREHGGEDHPLRYLSSAFESFEKPPTLNDDIHLQKRFAMRCLEVTNEMEDELHLQLGGGAHTTEALLESCIWLHGEGGGGEESSYFE